MITSNNLVGVFTHLVTNGHVDAAMPPNVDSISYAIQEQAGRLSPDAFLNWLDDLMDVPIDQNRVYASELRAIRQSSGKTPARLLVDQIRNTMPQEGSSKTFMGGVIRPNWISWLIIGLALIGLLCVLRFAGRVLGRVTG
jgi:hypothetical protein